METCEVSKCRNGIDLIYLGHGVCNSCYGKHCDKKINLKDILKIKDKVKI
jgi:hypothetical protein